MRKLITLLLLSTFCYGQAEFEKIAITENVATAETSRIVSQQPVGGELNYIDAVNLPLSTDTQTYIETRLPNKTVEQFGTIGVGNDTAVIQTALSSLVSGDYLIFNSPSYIVNSDLTFTAENVIVDGKNATITETTLTSATITGSASSGSAIKNFNFIGTENLVNWEAGNSAYRMAQRTFVRFLNSNNVTIDNIKGQSKRTVAVLENCDDSTVNNCYSQGFFGDILVNTVTESEYARCVTDTQGKFNLISNNTAYQTGAIVTLLQGGFHNVENNHGEELHDNGIYNSSCTFTRVSGNHVQWVKGSGVKCRSVGNTVIGNNIRHVGSGILMSGDGVAVDSYNTNGRYNIVDSNIISDIFTSSAINITIQDTYVSRDVRITNNHIYDHTPTDVTAAAIRILSSKGVDCSNNTIHNSTSTYAMLINGTAGTILKNNIISNNQLYLVKEGIRMTYVEESIVANNIFKDVTTASIVGRFINNSVFENNKSFNAVTGLKLDAAFSCNNNKVYNNDQVTASTTLNTVITDGTISGTRALLNSPIFTTNITTPAVNVSGATASTVAGFDVSKNLVSLATATYPSLTELSYVKGVTSSVQTQINNLATPKITITTAVSITTATNDAGGLGQNGRHVVIDNGANVINLTCNGSVTASYGKVGTGAITFVQGSGRTLVQLSGTAVFNGIAGSTATLWSNGTTDYLSINNY